MHPGRPAISPRDLVVVIDDDTAVLNSLKFSLEIDGFAVRVFGSGEELLGGTPITEAACLVVDYRLPAMDGVALIEELRRRGIDIPAIVITSNPSAALCRSAAEAGLVIVEKPLLGNALAETIRQTIKA